MCIRAAMLSAAFVAATMTANIMSLRMVAPLGIVMDGGALLYPLTFVLRDAIHRRAGLAAANATITMSVVCNVCMFCLFAFIAWLPADAQTGAQTAFGAVLMPGFLVVAGSVVAQFVSERVDGRIFDRVYRSDESRHVRAMLASNLVSVPLDSIIMCGIAFGFTVPLSTLCATTLFNIAIKYAVMLAFALIYALATPKPSAPQA